MLGLLLDACTGLVAGAAVALLWRSRGSLKRLYVAVPSAGVATAVLGIGLVVVAVAGECLSIAAGLTLQSGPILLMAKFLAAAGGVVGGVLIVVGFVTFVVEQWDQRR